MTTAPALISPAPVSVSPPSITLPASVTPPPAAPSTAAVFDSAVAPARERTRFALMFGPFASTAEAEKLERTLIRAGHGTVRTRQATAPAMYAVLIERVPTANDARAIIATLREQGIGEAAMTSTDPVGVRVGDPRPLRGAVELAERLRKAGYRVRVAAQPTERAAYVIRHGNFATRDEAEARHRELTRLSVPSAQVVPVR